MRFVCLICCLSSFENHFRFLPRSLSLFFVRFGLRLSILFTLPPTVKCWFLFCFVLLRFLFFSLFYTTLLYIFTELFCFCSVSVVNLCMCVHANVLCMCVFCSVLNLYSIKHDYHHCSFLLFILFYTSVTEFVIFCFGL